MPGPSVMVRVLGDVKGLGSSFDEASTKGTSAAGKLHSAFTGVLGTLNQTGVLGPFGAALAAADSGIQSISGHAKEIGPVMMGVGATVAGLGLALQAAGSKDAAAHAQLQASVQATGHDYEQYSGQVEAAIKHQENFGNTANETQDALRTLTQATGDPAKALDLLSTAADLAAAKHESLTSAAGQLGKAYNGSARIYKEFGVTTTTNTGAVKDNQQKIDELSAKLTGQASAAADTFSGKLASLKAKFEDQVATIGQKYGPAITAVGAGMTGVAAAIQVTSGIMEFFRTTTIFSTAATAAQTAAQWALNVAMSANPIMIIVIALAALIAVVILAYTHVAFFRNTVDEMGRVATAVFDAVVGAAQTAFGWIQANWPLLLAILAGPFGLAIFEIQKHWGDIMTFLRGLPGDVSSVVGGMWDSIGAAFRTTLNHIIDLWNSLQFTLPTVNVGPVHLGGETIGVPNVPHLAQGGLVTSDGLIYAHAGEAITPMPTKNLGPAVVIENASFATELDVDAFMRRAAWAARTAAL